MYPESCLQFHIQYYASHKTSNSLGWSTESYEYFLCHTVHGPKSSFNSKTTFSPRTLHHFPIHMNNKYEFSGCKRPITVFHRPGFVSSIRLDHLSLDSEMHKWTSDSNSISIVSSGFHMLATGIILVALNGTKDGRHRGGQCTSER